MEHWNFNTVFDFCSPVWRTLLHAWYTLPKPNERHNSSKRLCFRSLSITWIHGVIKPIIFYFRQEKSIPIFCREVLNVCIHINQFGVNISWIWTREHLIMNRMNKFGHSVSFNFFFLIYYTNFRNFIKFGVFGQSSNNLSILRIFILKYRDNDWKCKSLVFSERRFLDLTQDFFTCAFSFHKKKNIDDTLCVVYPILRFVEVDIHGKYHPLLGALASVARITRSEWNKNKKLNMVSKKFAYSWNFLDAKWKHSGRGKRCHWIFHQKLFLQPV